MLFEIDTDIAKPYEVCILLLQVVLKVSLLSLSITSMTLCFTELEVFSVAI